MTSIRIGTREIYYGWVIVAAVSITETVTWGIIYYGFPVFLRPMEQDLGASRVAITAAFSIGLGVAALAALPVGRWIDRHGGRALMTVGSCLATLLTLAGVDVHQRRETPEQQGCADQKYQRNSQLKRDEHLARARRPRSRGRSCAAIVQIDCHVFACHLHGWDDSEEDAGRNRERGRESEHGGINLHVLQAKEFRRTQRGSGHDPHVV